ILVEKSGPEEYGRPEGIEERHPQCDGTLVSDMSQGIEHQDRAPGGQRRHEKYHRHKSDQAEFDVPTPGANLFIELRVHRTRVFVDVIRCVTGMPGGIYDRIDCGLEDEIRKRRHHRHTRIRSMMCTMIRRFKDVYV